MPKTTLLVVGASVPVAVVPQQNGTTRILLYENGGGSTQNLLWMAPTSSDTQVTRPAGAEIELNVKPGSVPASSVPPLGYLLSASGSLNIVQEEYP